MEERRNLAKNEKLARAAKKNRPRSRQERLVGGRKKKTSPYLRGWGQGLICGKNNRKVRSTLCFKNVKIVLGPQKYKITRLSRTKNGRGKNNEKKKKKAQHTPSTSLLKHPRRQRGECHGPGRKRKVKPVVFLPPKGHFHTESSGGAVCREVDRTETYTG